MGKHRMLLVESDDDGGLPGFYPKRNHNKKHLCTTCGEATFKFSSHVMSCRRVSRERASIMLNQEHERADQLRQQRFSIRELQNTYATHWPYAAHALVSIGVPIKVGRKKAVSSLKALQDYLVASKAHGSFTMDSSGSVGFYFLNDPMEVTDTDVHLPEVQDPRLGCQEVQHSVVESTDSTEASKLFRSGLVNKPANATCDATQKRDNSGQRRGKRGKPRDNSAQPRDKSAQPRDNSGQPRDNSAQPRSNSAQLRSNSAQQYGNCVQPFDNTAPPRGNSRQTCSNSALPRDLRQPTNMSVRLRREFTKKCWPCIDCNTPTPTAAEFRQKVLEHPEYGLGLTLADKKKFQNHFHDIVMHHRAALVVDEIGDQRWPDPAAQFTDILKARSWFSAKCLRNCVRLYDKHARYCIMIPYMMGNDSSSSDSE